MNSINLWVEVVHFHEASEMKKLVQLARIGRDALIETATWHEHMHSEELQRGCVDDDDVLGDDVRAMLDKADHIVKAWTETMAQAEAIQTDRPEAEAQLETDRPDAEAEAEAHRAPPSYNTFR
jgi:hypothetical protein